MAIVLQGRRLAQTREQKLKENVFCLPRPPKLVVISMGHDSASALYLKLKQQAAQRVGMAFELQKFVPTAPLHLIEAFIKAKNRDRWADGIVIQLPLQLNKPDALINQISPQKDVDCLTDYNLARLRAGQALFLPATLKGILLLIRNSQFVIANSRTCVVGATGFVGKPVADYLEFLGAKVDRCNSQTANLSEHTRQANILISATGVPCLIKKEMVKPGALVIDVGSPEGDVDLIEVKKVAGAITPVPGGVGPLTIISLLENVFLAAQSTNT